MIKLDDEKILESYLNSPWANYMVLETIDRDEKRELLREARRTPGSLFLVPGFVWKGSKHPEYANFTPMTICEEYKESITFDNTFCLRMSWASDEKRIRLLNLVKDDHIVIGVERSVSDHLGGGFELVIRFKLNIDIYFSFNQEFDTSHKLQQDLKDIYDSLTVKIRLPLKDELSAVQIKSFSRFDIRNQEFDFNTIIKGAPYATLENSQVNGIFGMTTLENVWENKLRFVKKLWVDENGNLIKFNLNTLLSLGIPFATLRMFYLQRNEDGLNENILFTTAIRKLITALFNKYRG